MIKRPSSRQGHASAWLLCAILVSVGLVSVGCLGSNSDGKHNFEAIHFNVEYSSSIIDLSNFQSLTNISDFKVSAIVIRVSTANEIIFEREINVHQNESLITIDVATANDYFFVLKNETDFQMALEFIVDSTNEPQFLFNDTNTIEIGMKLDGWNLHLVLLRQNDNVKIINDRVTINSKEKIQIDNFILVVYGSGEIV